MHFVPMKGYSFFTPTTNTKTFARVVDLDIAGSPAHFNCDSQVG